MSSSVVLFVDVKFGTSKGLTIRKPFSTNGGVFECTPSLADSDRRSFAVGLPSGDASKSQKICRLSQLLHFGPVSLHCQLSD